MEGPPARAALLLSVALRRLRRGPEGLLDFCAFIPRSNCHARRDHEASEWGSAKAGGRISPLSRSALKCRPGGAPGGAAPVQRASQPRWIGRRASRAGVATPFVRRVPGASSAPARGLASPWRLPALHSRSERKMGTGGPAPAKQRGRRSVGFAFTIGSRCLDPALLERHCRA